MHAVGAPSPPRPSTAAVLCSAAASRPHGTHSDVPSPNCQLNSACRDGVHTALTRAAIAVSTALKAAAEHLQRVPVQLLPAGVLKQARQPQTLTAGVPVAARSATQ